MKKLFFDKKILKKKNKNYNSKKSNKKIIF